MADNNNSGGIGCFTVIGIVFVILKLVGVINWSWWWVTAPFWGSLALAIIVALIAGVVISVADSRLKSKRRW